MLRKITVFMLELILILVLGIVVVSIIAGVIQGLIIGSVGAVIGITVGLYIVAMNFVLTHLGAILGGGLLTFGGYITYRVLTDDDPL
jgi:hypothetical protein